MTDRELQEAVARICGKRSLVSCGDWDSDHEIWETPANSLGAWVRYCKRCDAHKVCSINGNESFWSIDEDSEKFEEIKAPDYLNDLNAMHEAEKKLTTEQGRQYVRELYQLTNGDFEFHCASAHKRAQAFVKILSEWNG